MDLRDATVALAARFSRAASVAVPLRTSRPRRMGPARLSEARRSSCGGWRHGGEPTSRCRIADVPGADAADEGEVDARRRCDGSEHDNDAQNPRELMTPLPQLGEEGEHLDGTS
uniref:DUF834 domain-containing protein n=1 Tax=Leersia perrieri TaxID=77586 RepID=A0A0D9X8P1_9ORYZ